MAMKRNINALQAGDSPIPTNLGTKRKRNFGPSSVQIPQSLLPLANVKGMMRCVSNENSLQENENGQLNKRMLSKATSIQKAINIISPNRKVHLLRRRARLNLQRKSDECFPHYDFQNSLVQSALLNFSSVQSFHSACVGSPPQAPSISMYNPERTKMEQFIVDAVREEFQPMIKDTRLCPKVDVRSLRSRDVELAEAAILGVGTFSRATKVTLKDRNTADNKSESKQIYACKQLKHELLSNVGDFVKAAAELAYEAFLLTCLDHPNVIKLRGLPEGGIARFGDVANEPQDMPMRPATSFFLIMDMLQETLDQRIDRWNTTLRPQSIIDLQQRNLEKISLCEQLASVLEYLHAKGIVYRDLKPQNIGFCEQQGGRLKLFDFGLCRELPSSIAESYGSLLFGNGNVTNPNEHKRFDLAGMVGTIRYMAPEVCLSQSYNRDCDIYSWSIVAWEIWSQKKPFSTFTPELYRSLVCKQGYRPTDETSEIFIPNSMTNLLEQAWKTEPHERMRWPKIREGLDIFQKIEALSLRESIIREDIAIQLRTSASATMHYPVLWNYQFVDSTCMGR